MMKFDCRKSGGTVELVGSLALCGNRDCPHGGCEKHLHKYNGQEAWEKVKVPGCTNDLWMNDGR